VKNRVSLGEVTEFIKDGTHGSPIRSEKGVPVLSATNIKDGLLNLATDRYTTNEEYADFSRRLPLAIDDVLLTIVGSIGRTAIVTNLVPLVFQRSVAILRPKKDQLDSRYLYHAIQDASFQAQLDKASNKSAQAGVYLGKLGEIQISLPSMIEQRRIAAILDKTDVIQKKRSEALGLADEFLRSVFLDIFGGLLSAPTDQWRSLGDCTDFIDYRGKTPEKSDGGIRLITAKNVRDGVINIEPAEFISETTYSWWMSRGYPQSGDILFTTEAPLGNIAVLRTDEPVAIGQRLIAIRPREMLRSDYLSWALRQDVIQRDIFSRATGSTVKGIRSAELVQVRVPIPSYDDQLKFERIVASVNHQKEVMHASAMQGEQLFQALQQQAFQGRL
jgi:type I restriction enzyme S subunit